jgi:hypothetical protein
MAMIYITEAEDTVKYQINKDICVNKGVKCYDMFKYCNCFKYDCDENPDQLEECPPNSICTDGYIHPEWLTPCRPLSLLY